MDTDQPLPHCLGLTSASEGVRIIYLAYIQVPNVADKVKFMFENRKSSQKLKHSTATTTTTTTTTQTKTQKAGNVYFPA
jgi:hypothetical protein